MIARLLSRLYRNVIIKEPEFGIGEDERVLLRGAATLEMGRIMADGTLILTSERLAFRPTDRLAFGGKRRILDIAVDHISGVSSGKKSLSALNPLKSGYFTVVERHDKSYTFITTDPGIWRDRIQEASGHHDRPHTDSDG
jgi:hypothetical protein